MYSILSVSVTIKGEKKQSNLLKIPLKQSKVTGGNNQGNMNPVSLIKHPSYAGAHLSRWYCITLKIINWFGHQKVFGTLELWSFYIWRKDFIIFYICELEDDHMQISHMLRGVNDSTILASFKDEIKFNNNEDLESFEDRIELFLCSEEQY